MPRLNGNKGTEDFRHLFDELYRPLCLFANKYLRDTNTSKDVVQEVFIKVWEKDPKFPNFNALKSFYYKSVKNRCLDYLKSSYYKTVSQSAELDDYHLYSEEFFLTEVVLTETYAQLDAAIKLLPKRSQRVIWLTLKSYSNKEIAEEMSISLNTVKSQKRIAYEKLRKASVLK